MIFTPCKYALLLHQVRNICLHHKMIKRGSFSNNDVSMSSNNFMLFSLFCASWKKKSSKRRRIRKNWIVSWSLDAQTNGGKTLSRMSNRKKFFFFLIRFSIIYITYSRNSTLFFTKSDTKHDNITCWWRLPTITFY